MSSPPVLFQNDWIVVTVEESNRLVRIRRTSVRFTDEALETIRPLASSLLGPEKRRAWSLLFDAREAPLMGNDDLEQRLGTASALLMTGFRRSAVLVATAVGKLQATRFSRANDRTTTVFDDEAAALRYLLAEPGAD